MKPEVIEADGNTVETRQAWLADWRSVKHLPTPSGTLVGIHLARHNENFRDTIAGIKAKQRPGDEADAAFVRGKELELKCWLQVEQVWRVIQANRQAFEQWWKRYGGER